jgi:hypothetical protein
MSEDNAAIIFRAEVKGRMLVKIGYEESVQTQGAWSLPSGRIAWKMAPFISP